MSFPAFFQGVTVNLFVLLGFIAFGVLVRELCSSRQRQVRVWQAGSLYGIMAFVAMLVPAVTAPGLIFDCRAGVIGAGALLGGPVTAAVSLPLPVVYRVIVGGAGTAPGVLEMILPAALGSAVHVWLRRRGLDWSVGRLVAASAGVGLISNGVVVAAVFLVWPALATEVGTNGYLILVLLNAPLSMALLSTLIWLEGAHYRAMGALADSERRMLHSQKMAAVGQLSRRIAHSFVNVLTTVMGHARLAREHADEPDTVADLMESVTSDVERVSSLTGELLAFSSPGSMRLRRMNLRRCLAGVEHILMETVGPEVKIEFDIRGKVGTVKVDPDRIEQAVVHMAVNASEAMGGQGTLTISVYRETPGKAERQRLQAGIHVKDRHMGAFGVIAVRDTGCGMKPETAERIFEPFFTTKKDRRNAGLGLATVYNIVQQHNGCIDVRTAYGQGTTFFIYLPIAGAKEARAGTGPAGHGESEACPQGAVVSDGRGAVE